MRVAAAFCLLAVTLPAAKYTHYVMMLRFVVVSALLLEAFGVDNLSVQDGQTVFGAGDSITLSWDIGSRGSPHDFSALVAHDTFGDGSCGPFLLSVPLQEDGGSDV